MSDESYHNEPKWFMTVHGKVQGPYEENSLKVALVSLSDVELNDALVWKRGLSEWLQAIRWQKNPGAYAEIEKTNIQPEAATYSEPVHSKPISTEHTTTTFQSPYQTSEPSNSENLSEENDVFEKTMTSLGQQNYRVQVNFVDQPVMTKEELLKLVAKQQDVSVISIQDPVSREWKDVYNFPEIIEKLGLSRRAHPRVPILAQFEGKSTNEADFSARIITISEGGMGFTEVFNLKIGDQVEGSITSPHFFLKMHVTAEVIYSGLDGYVGLKFLSLNEEVKSSIIDYVNKFKKGDSNG